MELEKEIGELNQNIDTREKKIQKYRQEIKEEEQEVYRQEIKEKEQEVKTMCVKNLLIGTFTLYSFSQ